MDIYNLIAGWTGWPFIVALLLTVGGYGYWVLNNRIEGLKESRDLLQTKLDEEKHFSPDVLVERLATRHKILCEELERLHGDEQANKQKISELESKREKIAEELGNTVSQLFKAVDSLTGYACAYCYGGDAYRVQIPVELSGKKLIFNMNATCYACGRRKTQVTSVTDSA